MKETTESNSNMFKQELDKKLKISKIKELKKDL